MSRWVDIALSLLVVAGLTGVMIPWCGPQKYELARCSGTKATLRRLEAACEIYEMERGSYPPFDQGGLVQALAAIGPRGSTTVISSRHIQIGVYVDSWGHPIRYGPGVHNRGRLDLWSCGPDGIDHQGGNDDLTNWR